MKIIIPICSVIILISLIVIINSSIKSGHKDAIILEGIGIVVIVIALIIYTIRLFKK